MLSFILVTVSIFLDGILSNFLPYMPNNLSFFTPLLTIMSLIIIYPLYQKKLNNYYILAAITGFIYDLLYTNLLFFNAILFLVLAFLIKYLYKYLETNYLNLLLYALITIIVYESLTATTLIIFGVTKLTLKAILYKIAHSILLNVTYIELLYLIVNLLPKKYKKININ